MTITVNIWKLSNDYYKFTTKKHIYVGTLDECMKFLVMEMVNLIPIDEMGKDPQFGMTKEVYENDINK